MKMTSKPAVGYSLMFDVVSPEPTHMFCGSNCNPTTVCPNCEKPLLRYLSLNPLDEKLELGALLKRSIDLYFCWRCPLAQSLFTYRLVGEDGIKILKIALGQAEIDFPYANYPEAFPSRRCCLSPLPDHAIKNIVLCNENRLGEIPADESIHLLKPAHQVGGVPILLQPYPSNGISCIGCGNEMPILASMGDDSGDGLGFTGNSYVQVIFCFCGQCRIVSAYQSCD